MSRTADALVTAVASVHLMIQTTNNRLRLRVRRADGTSAWVEYADVTEAEAVRRALASGGKVLAIEQAAQSSASTHSGPRFALLLFSQELLALLDAGLNLTEALSTLHAKERQPLVRDVLTQILVALREGRNFSDVLESMPLHFPDVYAATVRAAERTGDLRQALSRFIAYQLQFDTIRKKLISAAIYPVMLLAVGGFVALFLLGYVVPRFSAVYESSGRELPWLSSVLLGFGKAIHGHWQIALLGLMTVGALLVWVLARPQGRAALMNWFLLLPWFADKASEFRQARFYRAMSLLLASGIALPRAMGMVNGLLGPTEQGRLAQARGAVEQGQAFSTALLAVGLANPVAESLIKVGERSGQMADMLERTARFQDEDFARWIDWASKLIEPILMTVMGIVIGAIVVLMYMPIFDLAGSLQ
jgi:general secretion pathway protein F